MATPKYDYRVQILTGSDPDNDSSWTTVAFKDITVEKSLYWSNPTAITVNLDNNNGDNRVICALARRLRIVRNGVIYSQGIINTPESDIDQDESGLSIEADDYYRDMLQNKQTGDATTWSLKECKASDLIRMCIGTRFIVQEFFTNDDRINPDSWNNISQIQGGLMLTSNGNTYMTPGTVESEPLQTSKNDTMGDISSLEIIVNGVPAVDMNNMLTNGNFENGLTGYTATSTDFDVIKKEDSLTEWQDATDKSNVTAIEDIEENGLLSLARAGADMDHTEDLSTGGLVAVEVTSAALKLARSGADLVRSFTTTNDFAGGTGTDNTDNALRLAPTNQLYEHIYNTTGQYDLSGSVKSATVTANDIIQLDYQAPVAHTRTENDWASMNLGTPVNTCINPSTNAVEVYRVLGLSDEDCWNEVKYYYAGITSTSTIECDVYGDLASTEGWWWCNVFVGCDANGAGNQVIMHGKMFESTSNPEGVGTSSSWSSYTMSQSGAHGTLTSEVTYHVKIVLNGSTCHAYVGGSDFGSVTLNYHGGYFGFRANEKAGRVTNVIVYDASVLSGTRVSPGYQLPSFGTVSSNSVSWTQDTTYGTAQMEGSYDGTTWYTLTNGGAISGLNGLSCSGRYIYLRQTVSRNSSDAYHSGSIRNIILNVSTTGYYASSGYWESAPDSLATVGTAATSSITWVNDLPSGTAFTVKAAIATDGVNYSSWQTCTKNASVPGITNGLICTNAKIKYRVEMTGANDSTPTLHSLTVDVNCGRYTSGSWTSPVISLTQVKLHNSNMVTWTPDTPTGTTLTISRSIDGGAFTACTKDTAFNSYAPFADLTGKTVQFKVEMTGDGTFTPTLYDLTMTATTAYNQSGVRTSTIDLSSIGRILSTVLSWTPNTPTGTSILVEASLNGTDWTPCVSGQPCPVLSKGDIVSGATLHLRETMTTTSTNATPSLSSLRLTASTGYPATGYRKTNPLSINGVGTAWKGVITWELPIGQPPDTNVVVEASINGTDWTPCVSGQICSLLTNGTSTTGKTLYVRQTLNTTNCAHTPTIDYIKIEVLSQNSRKVAVDTETFQNGDKSLYLRSGVTPSSWYGFLSAKQAITADKSYALVTNTKGYTLGTAYVTLTFYNASSVALGTVTVDLSNIDDAKWTARNNSGFAPDGTTQMDVLVYVNCAAEFNMDDLWVVQDDGEVVMDLSRDGGNLWETARLGWDGAKWVGSHTFSGNETVKNQLKWRLTLTAQESNTKTPTVENIQLIAVTESDTGITEGHIDEFNSPTEADDLLTIDNSRKSRDDGIAEVIKITGQDAYVEDGKIYVYNHRGNVLAKTWTVGANFQKLGRKVERKPMCNRLCLIGEGQVNDNYQLVNECNVEDPESIALYGPIERTYQEKDLIGQKVVNNRAYVILSVLKYPSETISGILLDAPVKDWELGDQVTVDDPSNVTGVSNRALRITDERRAMSIDGETVELTFSNVNTDLESKLDALLKHVGSYMQTAQSAIAPTPVSYVAECDSDHPAEVLVYIDPAKAEKVEDILIFTYSRPFRSTTQATALESAHVHTIPSHRHGTPDHTHSIAMSQLNHRHQIIIDGRTGASANGSPLYTWGGGNANIVAQWPSDTSAIQAPMTSYMTTIDNPTVSLGGGGSTTDSGDLTATNAGSQHSHAMAFGIYEFGYYAQCRMYINQLTNPFGPFGIQGRCTATDDDTGRFNVLGMSLKGAFSSDNSRDLKPGVNMIYLRPIADLTNNKQGLLRIYVDVRVIYKS